MLQDIIDGALALNTSIPGKGFAALKVMLL
jgi:hypothetical protein